MHSLSSTVHIFARTMRLYFIIFACYVLCLENGFCQTVLKYGLTTDEQTTVLQAHNNYRKAVANGSISRLPKGTNLKRLKYDSALAQAAQKIANTTNFEHVSVTDGRWGAVGQNLYMSSSTGPSAASNWAAAVKAWYNEVSKYSYSKCCSSGTGHFTQVIWADTQYVGCGWVFYTDSSSYPYSKLYVCNYGPAGNYVGSYPYQNGTSGCENLCN